MAPGIFWGRLPQGACRDFAVSGRCRFGDKCRYSHSVASGTYQSSHTGLSEQQQIRPPREIGGQVDKFGAWKASASNLRSSTAPPFFFQDALSYVGADVATAQETILLLAKEAGLRTIEQVTTRDLQDMEIERSKKILKSQVIPLCQAITHPQVISSALLETALGTINNFIYGTQGQRAIKFFQSVLAIVLTEGQAAASSSEFEALLHAFANIIDGNTNALLIDNLKPLADTFFEIVTGLNVVEAYESRKLINRVNLRLGLGRQLRDCQFPKTSTPAQLPKFVFEQDLPGALSAKGPRHDNDHQLAEDICILPTFDEINAGRSEYLPSTSQEEWHRPEITGLLDRCFRLLREDTIGQLRDAVRHEIQFSLADGSGKRRQGVKKFTYENAFIVKLDFTKWQGLILNLRIDQPAHLRYRSSAHRKDWWEFQGRLKPDSLVCLLSSQGALVFCTVVEQKIKNVSNKQVEAATSKQEPRDLFTDESYAFITVSVATEFAQDVLDLMDISVSTGFKIVEFAGVLLPSFEPTLRALQTMLQDPIVPFAEYLVPGEDADLSAVPPPHYATAPGFSFELTSLMKDGRSLEVSTGDVSNHDLFRENTLLDEAQANALLASLGRSLALIQGPPGTGKSFTGIALVKFLLAAQTRAKLGPIICVCYTNHALDQVLEDLLRHDITQIVRIGAQSESQTLKARNLTVLTSQVELTKAEKQQGWELGSRVDGAFKEVKSLIRTIEAGGDLAGIKTYLETYHPDAYEAFFAEEDTEGFQIVTHHEKNRLDSLRADHKTLAAALSKLFLS